MATHLHGGDRLSALPAKALERILSHLPSDEAARASTLSRRWRGVSDSVPVVDLVDGKLLCRRGPGWRLPLCFDQQVTSAVLSKDPGTPIRVFRLRALQPPPDMLHQWILIAATSGAEEIDLELRYRGSSRRTICPFGRSTRASADFGDDVRGSYTDTPRQLFRCDTLRCLRLTNWTLDLPAGGDLFVASLETLCLKRIMAPGEVLQQLVAGCPCLADLTLEECPGVTEITVGSPRLRRFAMVCCHNTTLVVLPTRRLQSLHYKGCRPYDLQFLDLSNYDEIVAVTIDICDDLTCKGSHEVAPIMELISRCKNLESLHLALRPSMTCYSSELTAVIRGLPKLRQLVLKGGMATEHAIRSVTLFVDTQQLEVLTLFPLGPKRPKKKFDFSDDDSDSDADADAESCFNDNGDGHNYDSDDGHNYGNGNNGHNYGNDDGQNFGIGNNGHNYGNGDGHNYYDDDGDYDDEDYDDGYNYDKGDDNINGENYNDGDDYEMFRAMWRMGIPCFSHSLKTVNIAKYTGSGLDRILANFLLSKGRALEEFSVTLSAQLSPHKEEIAMEFRSWLCNPSAIVTCK